MSSFDEDIKEMRRETIAEVVFMINSSPKLYEQFKGKSTKEVKALIYEISAENDNWFGNVFEPLLDGLKQPDWKKIAESI